VWSPRPGAIIKGKVIRFDKRVSLYAVDSGDHFSPDHFTIGAGAMVVADEESSAAYVIEPTSGTHLAHLVGSASPPVALQERVMIAALTPAPSKRGVQGPGITRYRLGLLERDDAHQAVDDAPPDGPLPPAPWSGYLSAIRAHRLAEQAARQMGDQYNVAEQDLLRRLEEVRASWAALPAELETSRANIEAEAAKLVKLGLPPPSPSIPRPDARPGPNRHPRHAHRTRLLGARLPGLLAGAGGCRCPVASRPPPCRPIARWQCGAGGRRWWRCPAVKGRPGGDPAP
jgi:hypothetical protein